MTSINFESKFARSKPATFQSQVNLEALLYQNKVLLPKYQSNAFLRIAYDLE
jgi:hypothetical protein